MKTAWNLAWIGFTVAIPLADGLHAQQPKTLASVQETPFVENRGQWPEDVRFTARGGGWRAAIEERGWRLALAGDTDRSCVVRMHVRDCAGTAPAGLDPGAALNNYFYGERSGIGARAFARVRYCDFVPGVDLELRCEGGRLEYDLGLAPGASLSALVFEIEGATLSEIASDGSLTLETPLGELVQSPPRAFEIDAAGDAHDCASAFVRLDDTHFGFELRERSLDMRLVIDPALIWSTYIGGGTSQVVRAIVDAGEGSAVIAGSTDSPDFPVTAGVFDTTHNGASDAFVAGIDGQGRILWSTFLGGLGQDDANAIAINSKGVVTLAGTTRSLNFPATSGAFDTSLSGTADGFVARLAKAGSVLMWCTYLGGIKHDELHALAINPAGEPTVAGWTTSNNFPATPGAYSQQLHPGTTSDGCVARLTADGSGLVWATYLGGSFVDSIDALVLAPSGVLVGGATQSTDFPCTVGGALGGEDGFVALLSPSVTQLLMSTTVGASGDDSVRGVAVDNSGHLLAGGKTNSPALAVTAGVFGPVFGGLDDGFLIELDPTGATLACTFVGGAGSDEIIALTLSKTGELFATGWTDSVDFPTTPGAFDRLFNTAAASYGGDGFVIRASTDLTSLSYSTYFGAGDDDRPHAIAAIDFDTVLLAGETNSYFFPTTPGAHRTSRGVLATLEGFASRLDLLQHPIPFGVGKVNSSGSTPALEWTGFPSVAEHDFQFIVDSGTPNQLAVVFIGKSSWNQPFLGGTLYVRPPVKRAGAMFLDFVGYCELQYTMTPAAAGTTFFAQAWFRDPWDSLGCGLTSGLEVLVYP